MPNIESPDNFKDLPRAILSQMIVLSTGGFGVVVALAWNEVIKSVVETYIKPYLGQGSGVVSLLIYAIGITVIAVLVTMQLTKVLKQIKPVADKPVLKAEKSKKGK